MAGENVWPKSDGDIAFASDFNKIFQKTATVTWTTSFNTTNTSYEDVTNATITITGLTAASTYTLIAFATTHLSNNTAGQRAIVGLMINGTIVAETESNDSFAAPCSLFGNASVTGATSYIAKLQVKVSGNTGRVNQGVDTSRITVLAIIEA